MQLNLHKRSTHLTLFALAGAVSLLFIALVLALGLYIPPSVFEKLSQHGQRLTSVPLPENSHQVGEIVIDFGLFGNSEQCGFRASYLLMSDLPEDAVQRHFKQHHLPIVDPSLAEKDHQQPQIIVKQINPEVIQRTDSRENLLTAYDISDQEFGIFDGNIYQIDVIDTGYPADYAVCR